MSDIDRDDSRPRWARGLSAEQWRIVERAAWGCDHHWVALRLGYIVPGPRVDYSMTAAPDFGRDWLAEDTAMEEARERAADMKGQDHER